MRALLCGLLLCGVAFAEDFEEDENHVLILTHTNYDAALAEFPKLLVEFYAPVHLLFVVVETSIINDVHWHVL